MQDSADGIKLTITAGEENKNKNNNKAGRGQTDRRQQTDGSSHTMRQCTHRRR